MVKSIKDAIEGILMLTVYDKKNSINKNLLVSKHHGTWVHEVYAPLFNVIMVETLLAL